MLAVEPAAKNAVQADVVLLDGTIYDGSGGPPSRGDIAIRGDRIVGVGKFNTAPGARQIDCAGLIIAPGFIDLHNHSDLGKSAKVPETGKSYTSRPILEDATRPSMSYLTQGCTTIVTGNCGSGAVNVATYCKRIEANPPGVNVAPLVPQGRVRSRVIGDTRRAPTNEELQQMQALVRKGMEAGAWGMTTGLQYVPSAYADTAEIAALASVVAEYGGFYASHIRDEGDALTESVTEAIEIGRRSGAPVHISHFKASKRRNWGKVRVAANLIEAARQSGLRVTADQYPYAASSTSISAMLIPNKEREGGPSVWRERLNDPEQLARLKPLIEDALEQRERILVASCKGHPEWVGRNIRDIAAAEGREPIETALDILRAGSAQGVNFSMDPRDVRWVMGQPWVATASDGGVKVDNGTSPHPRSFGTFPRKIGFFSIEEQTIPLTDAIRSASGLPADILGVSDRGYLRVDAIADVVVLDPARFRDQATYAAPFEPSTGVRWLLVNGRFAIDEGQLADTTAGRVLRKSKQLADSR